MGYGVLSGDSGKMGHTRLSTTPISTGIFSVQIVVTDNLLFEGQFVEAYMFTLCLTRRRVGHTWITGRHHDILSMRVLTTPRRARPS